MCVYEWGFVMCGCFGNVCNVAEKKKIKRKMWSKKWHLKRNISCDVHLLNEWLETDVP
jgi:hypothetical protein